MSGLGVVGELAAGSAKYAVGGVLARAVSLISIPVYLRFLSAHDFGIQAIALIDEQILVILSGYAITNAVGKYYTEARRAGSGEGAVVATAAASLAILGLLFSVAWQAAAGPIARLTLDGSAASVTVVRLIGLSFFASLFANLALSLWQLRQDILLYSIVNIAKYVLAFALGLLFLGPFALGVVGVVLGWTLASVLTGTAAIYWLVRRFEWRIDTGVARRLGAYGAPLVPAALLMLLLNGSDRYILRQIADLSAVGVYATAYALASAVNLLLVTPFKQAWAPLMWRMRGHAEEVRFHRRVLRYYVAVMVVALVGVTVLAPNAMAIVAAGRAEFVAASFVVPIICIGFVLFGAYDVLSAGYFFAGRTVYYTVTTAASAILDIVLNLLLVPQLGVWGTALAFVASYAVFATLSGFFGNRFFPQGHEWRFILATATLGAAACTVFVFLRGVDPTLGLLAGLTLVAALPVALVLTSIVPLGELREMVRLVRPDFAARR